MTRARTNKIENKYSKQSFSEAKSWFCVKNNNNDKPLTRVTYV